MSVAATKSEMPETKRKLLDAAMHLMLRQGFTATTVDQICAESKLTKGSFFHYFKTKDEIGEAAIGHYCCGQQARFAEAGFGRMADPLERLHGFLDFIAKGVHSSTMVQGCLIGNMSQELSHTNPKIRGKCDEMFTNFIGLVTAMLREAKVRHHPKTDFDPESVAAMFLALMQGSLLVAKARQDKKLLTENMAHFRTYVDGLFGKSGKA